MALTSDTDDADDITVDTQLVDRQALVDVFPLAVPAVPFGFVVGLAITESAMPTWAGWLTAPLVFAGASQLAMITLAGSASVWAIILAVLVINSRHVMYSAALAPTFRRQPRWMRWVGPFVLIDQVFALSSLQTDRSPGEFRRYYLTVALTLFVVWNIVVPMGMVVGPVVPESWRLDYAPPIMFAGLCLFAINRVPAAVAALVGGFVSLATVDLRDRLGIVVGAVAGVIAAATVETLLERRSASADEPRRSGEAPVSSSAAIIVLVVATIGTYLTRSGLILALADRSLPAPIERALQYVGPAVLAALTINLAVGSGGVGSMELAEAASLIVAAAVAAWTRNLMWTFVGGMSTLWLLGAIT